MEEQRLADVRADLERFVHSRTDVDGDDVVQEAMTRLLENRARLAPASWSNYAVVSAGNILSDRERADAIQQRHAHRLHEPELATSPEEQAVLDEERDAVRRAMNSLDAPVAELLRGHYDAPEPSSRSLAPAAAARLARARAKLRVAYLLAHTEVPLPSPRCRPSLEALSTGDRRRQERLGVERHLLSCQVCASYAPALVERRRALAALYPLGWVSIGAGILWDAVRRRPGRTAAASTAVVTAVAVGAFVAARPPQAAPPPAPAAIAAPAAAATLLIAGQAILPGSAPGPLPVGPAQATDIVVQDVPANEGFWVGTGPGQRVWVELESVGESPTRVSVGNRLSFVGAAVRLEPGYAEAVGLTADEGSAELQQLGGYVRVRPEDVAVR